MLQCEYRSKVEGFMETCQQRTQVLYYFGGARVCKEHFDVMAEQKRQDHIRRTTDAMARRGY